MNFLQLQLLPLIAQQTRFSDLGQRFRTGPQSDLTVTELVGIIAGMIGIVLATWLLSTWSDARENRVINSQRQLFLELCRLHGIDWTGRRLLRALAKSRQLEHPVELFLRSSHFEKESLPTQLSGKESELTQLRDRLFSCEPNA